MQNVSVEQRLRRFLLAVVASIFAGTTFELVLLNHTEELLQWVPFAVSAVGLAAIAAVWFAPRKGTLLTLRWSMILTIVASFVGMYIHFSRNFSFIREINPSFTYIDAIWPAMKGSYPLLAPGILLLAGVLGLAAVWKHPKLRS